MTVVNKLTKKNQKYVQSGGFLMIIVAIGKFLLFIVAKIMEFMANLFRMLFMIRFDLKNFPIFLTLDPGEGLFYKYLWFSMKCGFFLVIFAFGGPLIALIGVAFMYKNLFKKMGELKQDEDDKEEKSEASPPKE